MTTSECIATSLTPDVLHKAGCFLITQDTRYVVIAAIVVALIIFYIKYLIKKKDALQDGRRLILTLLEIYALLGVLSVFLFTKPPAISALSGMEFHVFGVIVSIILCAGIYQELKEYWKK